MRPPSIVMFERLFLASMVLSVLAFIVGYDTLTEQLANEPGLSELGLGAGFLTGIVAVSVAIYLLLWFLIARKASSVAKWILIVLLALSLFSLPAIFAGVLDLIAILNIAVYALELAAVVHLFRADAVAWFRGEWNTDPTTFD